MADEQPGEFSLVPQDGEPRKYPEEYEGQGTATYPNGDRYIGQWKKGVSADFNCRKEMEKAFLNT